MTRDRTRSGAGFEAVAAYSRAVRHGSVVAVSGTAALDEHGHARWPGDAYAQTRDAFASALDAAKPLGVRPSDVIRTRIFLAPDANWQDAIKAHRELFDGIYPANTTLYVAKLIPVDALVEVEVDAVVE